VVLRATVYSALFIGQVGFVFAQDDHSLTVSQVQRVREAEAAIVIDAYEKHGRSARAAALLQACEAPNSDEAWSEYQSNILDEGRRMISSSIESSQGEPSEGLKLVGTLLRELNDQQRSVVIADILWSMLLQLQTYKLGYYEGLSMSLAAIESDPNLVARQKEIYCEIGRIIEE
jgi:hypothetical protein